MKNISPFLLFLVSITLFTVFGGCAYITGEAIKMPTPTLAAVKNINPQEANDLSMLSGYFVQWVDVRTPEEYGGGHIGNAVNINYYAPDFKEKIDQLDKTTRYIVYCRTGARSAAASKVMTDLGFKDIYNMLGGFSAWAEAGLPVNQ